MAKKAKPKPLQVILERKGDFYECHPDMNDGDVIRFASLVNILMIQRNGRLMTGFPFHQIDVHINKIMDCNPDSVVTIHDADGGVRMFTTGETGNIEVKQLVSPQTNNNKTTSKNNKLMETNNNSFNPNFSAYDCNNGFIMLDGEYRQFKTVSCIHYYGGGDKNGEHADETIHELDITGVGTRKFVDGELRSIIYRVKEDVEACHPVERRELTVRPWTVNNKHRIDSDRKAYIIRDGQLQHVTIIPDAFDITNNTFIKYTDEVIYKTKDDALAFNTITVRNEDGTTEKIGGEWSEVLPTTEQMVLVEQLKDLFAKMKDAKLGIAFDRESCVFEAYNAEKAYIEYDGCQGSALSGWHLPEIKGVSVYDYNSCDEYHVHLYSKEAEA